MRWLSSVLEKAIDGVDRAVYGDSRNNSSVQGLAPTQQFDPTQMQNALQLQPPLSPSFHAGRRWSMDSEGESSYGQSQSYLSPSPTPTSTTAPHIDFLDPVASAPSRKALSRTSSSRSGQYEGVEEVDLAEVPLEEGGALVARPDTPPSERDGGGGGGFGGLGGFFAGTERDVPLGATKSAPLLSRNSTSMPLSPIYVGSPGPMSPDLPDSRIRQILKNQQQKKAPTALMKGAVGVVDRKNSLPRRERADTRGPLDRSTSDLTGSGIGRRKSRAHSLSLGLTMSAPIDNNASADEAGMELDLRGKDGRRVLPAPPPRKWGSVDDTVSGTDSERENDILLQSARRRLSAQPKETIVSEEEDVSSSPSVRTPKPAAAKTEQRQESLKQPQRTGSKPKHNGNDEWPFDGAQPEATVYVQKRAFRRRTISTPPDCPVSLVLDAEIGERTPKQLSKAASEESPPNFMEIVDRYSKRMGFGKEAPVLEVSPVQAKWRAAAVAATASTRSSRQITTREISPVVPVVPDPRIKELQKELDSFRQRERDFTQREADLKTKMSKLESELHLAKASQGSARGQSKIRALEEEKERANRKSENLEKELQLTNQRMLSLREECNRANEKADSMQLERDRANNSAALISGEKESAIRRFEAIQADMMRERTRIADLQSRLRDRDERINVLEREVGALRHRVEEQNSMLAEYKAKLDLWTNPLPPQPASRRGSLVSLGGQPVSEDGLQLRTQLRGVEKELEFLRKAMEQVGGGKENPATLLPWRLYELASRAESIIRDRDTEVARLHQHAVNTASAARRSSQAGESEGSLIGGGHSPKLTSTPSTTITSASHHSLRSMQRAPSSGQTATGPTGRNLSRDSLPGGSENLNAAAEQRRRESEMNRRLMELQAQTKSAWEELKVAEGKLRETEGKLREAEGRAQDTAKQLSTKSLEADELRVALGRKDREYRAQLADKEAEIRKLQRKIEDLSSTQSASAQLQSDLDDATQRLVDLQRTAEEGTLRERVLDETREALEAQLKETVTELQNCIEELSTVDEQRGKAERDLENARKTAEILEKERDELVGVVEEMEHEIESTTSELEKARRRVKEMTAAAGIEAARLADLERDKRRAEEEVKKLRGEGNCGRERWTSIGKGARGVSKLDTEGLDELVGYIKAEEEAEMWSLRENLRYHEEVKKEMEEKVAEMELKMKEMEGKMTANERGITGKGTKITENGKMEENEKEWKLKLAEKEADLWSANQKLKYALESERELSEKVTEIEREMKEKEKEWKLKVAEKVADLWSVGQKLKYALESERELNAKVKEMEGELEVKAQEKEKEWKLKLAEKEADLWSVNQKLKYALESERELSAKVKQMEGEMEGKTQEKEKEWKLKMAEKSAELWSANQKLKYALEDEKEANTILKEMDGKVTEMEGKMKEKEKEWKLKVAEKEADLWSVRQKLKYALESERELSAKVKEVEVVAGDRSLKKDEENGAKNRLEVERLQGEIERMKEETKRELKEKEKEVRKIEDERKMERTMAIAEIGKLKVELMKEKERAENTVKEKEEHVKSVRRETSEKEGDLSSLKEKLRHEKESCERMERELKEARDSAAALSGLLKEKEKEAKKLEEALKQAWETAAKEKELEGVLDSYRKREKEAEEKLKSLAEKASKEKQGAALARKQTETRLKQVEREREEKERELRKEMGEREALRKMLGEKEEREEGLKRELSEKEGEIWSVKEKLRYANVELDRLKAEKETAEDEGRRIGERMKEMERKMDELRKTHGASSGFVEPRSAAAASNQNESTSRDMAIDGNKIDAIRLELAERSAELWSVREKLRYSEDGTKQLAAELAVAEARIAELERENTQMRRVKENATQPAFKEIEAELSAAREKLRHQTEQTRQIANKLAAAEMKIHEMEKRTDEGVVGEKEREDRAVRELTQKETELWSVQEKFRLKAELCEKLEADLRASQSRLDESEKETCRLAETERKIVGDLEGKAKEIAILAAARTEVEREKDEMASRVRRLQDAILDLRQEKERLENENREGTKEKLRETEREMERTRSEESKLRQKLETANQNAQYANQRYDSANQRLGETQTELKRTLAEVQSVRSDTIRMQSEIKGLQAKIQVKDQTIQSLSATVANQNTEIRSMRDTLSAARDLCEELEAEEHDARERYERAELDLAEILNAVQGRAGQMVPAMRDVVGRWEAERGGRDAEMQKLEAEREVERLKRNQSRAEGDRERLEREKRETESEMRHMEEVVLGELAEREEEVKLLRREVEEFGRKMVGNVGEEQVGELLRERVVGLESELRRREAEVRELKERLSDLEKENTAMEKRAISAEEREEETQRKMRKMEGRMATWERRTMEMNETAEEKEREIQALTEQMSRVKGEIEGAKGNSESETERKLKKAEGKLATWERRTKEIAERLEEKENEIRARNEEIARLKKVMENTATGKESEMEMKLKNAEGKMATWERRTREMNQKAEEKEDEIRALAEEMERMGNEKMELERKLAEMKRSADGNRAEVGRRDSENEKRGEEAEGLRKRAEEMERRWKETEAELSRMGDVLAERQRLADRVSDLENERARLANSLATAERTSKVATNENDKLQAQIDDLIGQCREAGALLVEAQERAAKATADLERMKRTQGAAGVGARGASGSAVGLGGECSQCVAMKEREKQYKETLRVLNEVSVSQAKETKDLRQRLNALQESEHTVQSTCATLRAENTRLKKGLEQPGDATGTRSSTPTSHVSTHSTRAPPATTNDPYRISTTSTMENPNSGGLNRRPLSLSTSSDLYMSARQGNTPTGDPYSQMGFLGPGTGGAAPARVNTRSISTGNVPISSANSYSGYVSQRSQRYPGSQSRDSVGSDPKYTGGN